jgi:hypothetical protein
MARQGQANMPKKEMKLATKGGGGRGGGGVGSRGPGKATEAKRKALQEANDNGVGPKIKCGACGQVCS